MWNKIACFCLICLGGMTTVQSQNCNHILNGEVQDFYTQSPLGNVRVYFQEEKKEVYTDSLGVFQLSIPCNENAHLTLSHPQCTSTDEYIKLDKDSTLIFYLEHGTTQLNEVVATANTHQTVEVSESVQKQEIMDDAGGNLTDALENIIGVRSLKNGNKISKPIVNGMYGNRLTILNNGVPQSGQQWGNDHSPEIDPLAAHDLEVIKGTSSLEYMGSNLGNVVLVNPSKIGKDPHIHGNAGYQFDTNGRGNALHFQSEQNANFARWRLQGSGQKFGDFKSPDYFLTNTGSRQFALSMQLEKQLKDNWDLNFYGSMFNAQLGILRGSQVGNLTDLEEAIHRSEPFYTVDQFSYKINAPRQKVNHQLYKLYSENKFNNQQKLKTTLSIQYDQRKEFDVRRGNRSDIPALSLDQFTFNAEAKYEKEWANDWELHTGFQYRFINNYNVPETNILPLIPNYNSWEEALFAVVHKKYKNMQWEGGLRYNNTSQEVKSISSSYPREVLSYKNHFQNVTASLAYMVKLAHNFTLRLDAGLANRNPAINELYSNGLHQGVSGIEVGDPNLKSEHSAKGVLGINYKVGQKVKLELNSYYQSIKNYIFLNPTGNYRLTIRGAFPLYDYQQTDAVIYGIDAGAKMELGDKFFVQGSYSYLRGKNTKEDIPLVYMPPNNGQLNIGFNDDSEYGGADSHWQNLNIQLIGNWVAKQNYLLEDQDFLAPPDAYFLLGTKAAIELHRPKVRWRFTLAGQNLLNTKYRDYMNRLRYFADETGINLSFGIQLFY